MSSIEKPCSVSIEISPQLPSYSSIIETQPPPPTYMQSTMRLYYKNQPYITDFDQLTPHSSCSIHLDNWSEICQLPLHQRLKYYLKSWANTIYDGRFIFFSFFVLASIVILGLVIAFITVPNLLH